jgi:hypothetical protein
MMTPRSIGGVLMCYWFEDDLLDELEASRDEFFGGFKQIAKTIGRVARRSRRSRQRFRLRKLSLSATPRP